MAFLMQNMNQFTQSPIIGAVDLIPTPDVVTAQINPASVATAIQAGSAVKLLDGASGAILVDVQTGPTDAIVFGVIPFNERKNIYKAGDLVEVVLAGFMYMRTTAAINRGVRVSITAATITTDPLIAANAVSANFTTGVTIDKATAADQLIRVRIQPLTNP